MNAQGREGEKCFRQMDRHVQEHKAVTKQDMSRIISNLTFLEHKVCGADPWKMGLEGNYGQNCKPYQKV